MVVGTNYSVYSGIQTCYRKRGARLISRQILPHHILNEQMLRGMDDFAGYATDDKEKCGSTEEDLESRKGRVSVNFVDEGPVRVPNRTESRDTDTESFTYEHFPVVCPTCRGTGRVHQGNAKFDKYPLF